MTKPDPKLVEQIVEIITHEVLAAMAEQEQRASNPEAFQCKFECADQLCVKMCLDKTGSNAPLIAVAGMNHAAPACQWRLRRSQSDVPLTRRLSRRGRTLLPQSFGHGVNLYKERQRVTVRNRAEEPARGLRW